MLCTKDDKGSMIRGKGIRGRVLFLIVFSGLKDEMLEESENFLDPHVLATEIVEDLECGTRTIPPNHR